MIATENILLGIAPALAASFVFGVMFQAVWGEDINDWIGRWRDAKRPSAAPAGRASLGAAPGNAEDDEADPVPAAMRAGWPDDAPPHRYFISYTVTSDLVYRQPGWCTVARTEPMCSAADVIGVIEYLQQDYLQRHGQESLFMISAWQKFEPTPPKPKRSQDLPDVAPSANIVVLRRSA